MKALVQLGLTAALWMASSAAAPATGGRFFASARQCESARTLAPGACRTAFANALAEFAAKAPSYRSRRACFKAFGPCMPWPMGTHRFNEFRPQWIGIIVAADAAAPAVAPGRLRFEFAPQPTASLSPAAALVPARPMAPAAETSETRMVVPDYEGHAADGPPARAGGGFTVIDGVLTYPAPARFQPKSRKRP